MPQPTPVSPTNRLNKLGKYVNVGPLSIGGSRGPGGTCPLDRLTQKNDFFLCTFLVVLCQIGEQSKMSATTPPHRIGSALGDHGKCLLLSPPPLPYRVGPVSADQSSKMSATTPLLNLVGFLRPRQISVTTPLPVSCCAPPRLPAPDPPC